MTPPDKITEEVTKLENEGKVLGSHTPNTLGKELLAMPRDERLAVMKKIQQDEQTNSQIGKWNFTDGGVLLSIEKKSPGADERVSFDPKTGLKRSEDWSLSTKDVSASRHSDWTYNHLDELVMEDTKRTTKMGGGKVDKTLTHTSFDPQTGTVTDVVVNGKAVPLTDPIQGMENK